MTFPPIEQLLPHRPPMLLLDRVTAHDELSVCCETVVGARQALLLGTRKYQSQLPVFAASSLLRIEAHCLLQDAGMASFECSIWLRDRECARARLSTYQPTEAQLTDLLEQKQ